MTDDGRDARLALLAGRQAKVYETSALLSLEYAAADRAFASNGATTTADRELQTETQYLDSVALRALLADADVFALIYPLWLNSPPAILKGYLERVFGFGFAYGKNGRSLPLLAGRRLISFSSSGAPLHWIEQTGAFGAVKTLFDRYLAEISGMTFVDHIHFGAIVPGIRDDAVARFLAQTRAAVETHFGRPA